MTLWQRLLFALATGYVFFFYSERMFWSFLRADDAILFQVIAWLLYSLFTYMTLAIIASFNVNTLWPEFNIEVHNLSVSSNVQSTWHRARSGLEKVAKSTSI